MPYQLGALLHRHLGTSEGMDGLALFKDNVLYAIRNLGCRRLLASMLVLLPPCTRDLFWGWYHAAYRMTYESTEVNIACQEYRACAFPPVGGPAGWSIWAHDHLEPSSCRLTVVRSVLQEGLGQDSPRNTWRFVRPKYRLQQHQANRYSSDREAEWMYMLHKMTFACQMILTIPMQVIVVRWQSLNGARTSSKQGCCKWEAWSSWPRGSTWAEIVFTVCRLSPRGTYYVLQVT